jgi:hypothetical protein
MYLDIGVRAPKGLYLRVPHSQLPMTVQEITKHFSGFAREMDGSANECTLRFFYKKDKDTGVYEFLDVDSEEEVAELMGVSVLEIAEEEEVDSDGELIKTTSLTDEQLQRHKTNLAQIREGLKAIESDSSDSDTDWDSDSDTDSDTDTDSD